MNKLNTTIILSLILMLSGCAANTDEAPSATTAATTTTTVATTTTAAATTQATTTSAQTTAVTEQSEPVETTVVTTTVATTTASSTTTAETEIAVEEVSDEYKDTYNWDKNREQTRQDMAEDTDAYTTDGIPLTSRGNLTAPAKPTANYKLPDDAQLEFTGDASTALLTELPEGCYWVPGRGGSENAFMDPAGNLWLNTVTNTTTNCGEGYYSPDGTYHHSQAETDRAIALNQASQDIFDNGPSGDGMSGMTEQEIADLDAMLGI